MVVVDLVKSTELLDRLGTDAAIASRRAVDEIINRSSDASNGQTVDTNGDGTIIVFESCNDAIDAAESIQEQTEMLRDASGTEGLQLRVGAAVDEVPAESWLSSAGTDLANGLCENCEPGAVAFSDLANELRGS